MPKVSNVEVFGLASSIYRSGYPMMDHAPSEDEFRDGVAEIEMAMLREDWEHPHLKRATHLANAKGGGHDQFLTGIVVNFDLTISNKAWVEAERYTFLNFISSMSTMHRAAVLPIKDCCNEYVEPEDVAKCMRLQDEYNAIDGHAEPERKKDAYLRLLYNLPAGFELTAAMTTNYRCFKNMRAQRRHHRLPDWWYVCDWIETLPAADKLIFKRDAE